MESLKDRFKKKKKADIIIAHLQFSVSRAKDYLEYIKHRTLELNTGVESSNLTDSREWVLSNGKDMRKTFKNK